MPAKPPNRDPRHTPSAIELAQLGAAQINSGNPEAALPLLERALELHLESGGEPEEGADILNAVGVTYRLLHRLEESQTAYTQALALARARLEPAHPLAARVLENLTMLARLAGRDQEARAYFGQALDVYRAQAAGPAGPEAVTGELIALGQRLWRAGAVAEAEMAWREALKQLTDRGRTGTPEIEQVSGMLFSLYQAQGRMRDAMGAMSAALVLGPRHLWRHLVRHGQRQREELLRQHRADVDRLLSNLLRWGNDPAAAETALDVLLWRRGFGLELYRCANRAARADPEVRARVDQLKHTRAASTALLLQLPADSKRPFHTQVHWEGLGRSPELAEAEIALFSSLAEEHSLPAIDPPDCASVAARLPRNGALVEYWRCRQVDEQQRIIPRYLALVLRPGAEPDRLPLTRLIDLGPADAIEDGRLDSFLAALTRQAADSDLPRGLAPEGAPAQAGEPNPQVWRALGRELRGLLVDPLLPALGGAQHLLIVPDGLLPRLPFGILPSDDGGFLLDNFTISYLTSGRDLLAEEAPPDAAHPALVLAAPDYDLAAVPAMPSALSAQPTGLSFPPLLGALFEGQEVAELLGVKAVVGAAATEGCLKACRGPRVLHLSTHGLLLPARPHVAELDPIALQEFQVELRGTVLLPQGLGRLSGRTIDDQALRSMLILAGANTWLAGDALPDEAGDGWLNAEDIAQLDLYGNELTVLSACETGLGAIAIGEGVLGLRSAFQVAGARTVVMSLWRVPDDLTRELMLDFYDALPTGRATALVQAQRKLRRRHPERPDYWGAFICQGDWRSLAVRVGTTPAPVPP